MTENIRWKQRFDNFEKAFILLRSVFDIEREFSDLEKEGIVQRFEYSFELSWKVIKDYLEENGVIFDEASPKKIIKKAFAVGIIKDGEGWIEMLIERNLLSHNYNQKIFTDAIEKIRKNYIEIMGDLYIFLKDKYFE